MSKSKKALKALIEIILTILVAFLCVALIQQLVFMPVGVQGISMVPTIREQDDTAYVQKIGYELEANEIVVFYRPLTQEANEIENPAQSNVTFKEFFTNFLHLKTRLNTDNDSSTTEDGNFICVIKRVIGIPGDKIEIKDAVLYRNGEAVEDFPMTEKSPIIIHGVNDIAEFTVPEGEYFVLGDNRDYSYDSEDYGCIKEDWILGEVIMIISRGSEFGMKFV